MYFPTTRSAVDCAGRPRQSSRRVPGSVSVRTPPSPSFSVAVCLLWLLLSWSPSAQAASLTEARQLYRTGQYAACAEQAVTAISEGYYGEDWPLLKIQSDLQLGRYDAALKTLDTALETFKYSVRLRHLGRRVALYNNQPERATALAEEAAELATRTTYRYGDSANRVALGRLYLDRGADPRRVLETFYDPVKNNQPQLPEAFVAAGDLALAKNDYALAAEEFENALKRAADDPDIQFGLASAYAPSDPEKANQYVEAALKINPHHIPTLLFVVDNKIDAENYDDARTLLKQVLEINPSQEEAWAYHAVLAHLAADAPGEQEARKKALAHWRQNPHVDHLIGKKLSQKYRFAEGAEYQRRAIALDASYLPAQIQLAQDLLRLGDVQEGWQRAELVYDVDAYNIVAHNLVQLKDTMARFATLENESFIVRMDAREAAIYGGRVLRLLEQAKQALGEKYDQVIDEPVTIEIFPQQQDFAIRTFGLPGGQGFLGVCFGRVITANSPASQGTTPSNLDSVLWHEFCHVITLQKTHNRMPRWLSEGISVYEERQRNPAWGQSMDALYRSLIVGGELTPVSQLSGAFLQPKSALHLQFAYYESSLVVQYLVDKYGQEVLNRILTDLGIGMPINESLGRYTGDIAALDKEFEAYARQLADEFAPQANWDEANVARDAGLEQWQAWLEQHPNNVPALRQYATRLIAAEQFEEAESVGRTLVDLCPLDYGPSSGHALLAAVYRKLQKTPEELEHLEAIASHSDDDLDTYQRLLDLHQEAGNWPAVAVSAERMLAVNPLIPAPHRLRARAAEELQDAQAAVESYQALLKMDPADPAGLHYQLAHHLQQLQRLDAARRHVLMALEEAPRFQDAHRLLLDLVPPAAAPDTPEPPAQADPDQDITKPDITKPDNASKPADGGAAPEGDAANQDIAPQAAGGDSQRKEKGA